MFVRMGAVLLALGAAAPSPVAPQADFAGTALAAQCRGKDGWADPAPPARVFGNVFDVGTCGIVVLLVTSPRGHILIDGATAAAVPLIAANIARLGYRMRDVRILLNSHPHGDHAGGLAELKRLTGARLLVRAPTRRALERGGVDPEDPQAGLGEPFAAVRVDGVAADGQVVRLGPLALTALATPGHTPGSTSWSWRSCAGRVCRSLVYADSVTALSNDAYRFSDRPAYVAAFERSLDRIAALDCDILVTPHPAASRLFERLAGREPLIDRGGCARYAAAGRARLAERLLKERTR